MRRATPRRKTWIGLSTQSLKVTMMKTTKTTTKARKLLSTKSVVKSRTKGPSRPAKVASKSSHPPTRKSPATRKSSREPTRLGAISEGVCTCGQRLVQPFGPPEAKVGVISEYPGEVELKTLVPMTGPAGNVFWREWRRAGLPYARVTNVWQHEPAWDDQQEYDEHLKRAIQHVAKCRVILLLGGTATTAFLDTNVMSVSGLWSRSPLLGPRPVLSAPNPAVALRSTVGELRLALTRLKERKELQ